MKNVSNCTKHRSAGFTLVELMVGLAVMGVLLVVALPSFQSTIASNRVTTITNDLVGSLAVARTEAIRRGVRVTVCISADNASCATSGNWEQGWIVFTDNTRSLTTASVDSGEAVLATGAAVPAGITVKGNANAVQFVSYAPDGQAKAMNGNTWTGKLQVCSNISSLSNDRRARLIDISTTGRVQTTTPTGISTACDAPT